MVGNVAHFPTKAHFASYSGAAPVEASSGEVVRHRLSLAGNRKLNNALHMVAVCQARSDARGGSGNPFWALWPKGPDTDYLWSMRS